MKRMLAALAGATALATPSLAADPRVEWRMASGSNWTNNEYAPGALGFTLADVSSLSILNRLPEGVKGIVYVGPGNDGCAGPTIKFRAFVDQFKDNPKLWGFYLMDEPYAKDVGSKPACAMSNLKAETEYIHANFTNAKTFVKLGNIGNTQNPNYDDFGLPNMLDVYGIGGYPCRTANAGPDKCEYAMIARYVAAAVRANIPKAKMAPTVQAFGGWDGVFVLPDAHQEQKLLEEWKKELPNPPMTFAYSYGKQDKSTGSIATSPELQAVFKDWNESESTPTEPEIDPPTEPEGPECVPCCQH